MNTSLSTTFKNFSYITDKNILSNILNKLDKKEVKHLEKFRHILYNYNKHTDINDLIIILSKLETNLVVQHHTLQNKEDELSYHLKVLNQQNLQYMIELFTMIESKELVHKA
jgi:sulfatase maturation enzyme AslB (radical SAM superfamily)